MICLVFSEDYPFGEFVVFITLAIVAVIYIYIIIIVIIIIIKNTISSNLIGSFNTLFFLTLKSVGKCPITKCCYWTPVIRQLNKPITT